MKTFNKGNLPELLHYLANELEKGSKYTLGLECECSDGVWNQNTHEPWQVVRNVGLGQTYRIRTKNRIINGYVVPAPIDYEATKDQLYFIENAMEEECYSEFLWDDDRMDKRWLKRSMVYLTKEAAILNTKARYNLFTDEEKEQYEVKA